jgi:hypothetical protein
MKTDYRQTLLPLTALILLFGSYALLAWPALSGPFIFDDFPNLQNLAILNSGVTVEKVREYLASFLDSPGRPLAALSFLLNATHWPAEPYSFKVTNLVIHLINGGLLYGLLRQWQRAAPVLPQHVAWPLLAVAIWLFHPLQLSAQMLVVQRMTLLSTSFCLIGLWSYTALLMRAKNTHGAFLALAALGTCTLLAFLCKENGALLPLLAWVANATILRPLIERQTTGAKRLLAVGCTLPVAALMAGMIHVAMQPNAFAHRDFGLYERLLTQLHVLGDYIRHILLPRLSGSGLYFDDYPITRALFDHASTVLLALAMLTAALFALLQRKRWPLVSFGILWFFAGHLMESTLLPLELYFEHRNYLPLLAFAMVLSAIPFRLQERASIGFGLIGLWLALLALISGLQAPVWGDAQRLVHTWASERPASLRATQELARYHYDAGNPQQAVDVLAKAYARGMPYADLPLSMLLAKCWQPQVNLPFEPYKKSIDALHNAPFSTSTLTSLKYLRQSAQNGQCPDTIDGSQWLELSEAMLAQPKYRVLAAGNIHIERANYFIAKRDLNGTMREFEAAYAVAPSVPLSLRIAEVLISAGLLDEAEAWITKGMSAPQPLFDRLMYDQTMKSRRLLVMLAEARKTQPPRQ